VKDIDLSFAADGKVERVVWATPDAPINLPYDEENTTDIPENKCKYHLHSAVV